jgi:hypothetical protein
MTATFHMCQLNGCVGMDRSIPIENKIYGKTERTPCDHSLLDFQIFHLPDGSRRRFQKANTDLSISDDPQGTTLWDQLQKDHQRERNPISPRIAVQLSIVIFTNRAFCSKASMLFTQSLHQLLNPHISCGLFSCSRQA